MRPGSAEVGQEKLFLLEPRQPGKYPLVFVHGFFSSPAIWANIANEIMAQPDLRNCYQLVAYRYPTGRPFLESAAVLRSELNAFVKTYDSQAQDPAMYNMAMVAHSMGGLVAKLTVTRSDDRLWYAVANRPLSEINVSESRTATPGRAVSTSSQLPFVRRVVFMGTPHHGAVMASQACGRISSRCVQYPTAELIEHELLIKQNPGVFSPEFEDRIPTSIDMMEKSSCLLQAIERLCPGDYVQFHNIIGTKCLSPLEGLRRRNRLGQERTAPVCLHGKTCPHDTRWAASRTTTRSRKSCASCGGICWKPTTNRAPRNRKSRCPMHRAGTVDPCPTLAVPDECVEVPGD